MAFSLPGVPFKLSPEDMGVPDLTTALSKGIQLGFQPAQSQANLQKTLADNIHQALVNKYYGRDIESQIGARGALADYQNTEAAMNRFKLGHPGLLGSPLMVDATIAQLLKNQGGQQAVDTHEQIKQAYPDAPLQQTVPLALQIAQSQTDLSQPKMQTMQDSITNALQQQQSMQQAQQPIQQMPALQQSLNNVLNPPQPQQQIQQVPAQQQDLALRAANAEIAKEEAMSKYYGEGAGKGGVKVQNLNNLSRIVDKTYPDLSDQQKSELVDAYLDDKTVTASGMPVPPASGEVEQALQNVLMANVPAALQTQYYQMANLVNDINNFPIEDLASLTGPTGAAKLKYAQAKMAVNPDDPNIDPVARRYLTAVNQSTITMDKTRKAWGTSVQPKYVQNTIGKLTNPNDSMWLDKTQVLQNFNAFKDAMNRDLGIMKYKVRHGATTEAPEETKNPKETSVKMVTIIDPEGGEHKIPEGNVDAAIKKYPGTKRKKE